MEPNITNITSHKFQHKRELYFTIENMVNGLYFCYLVDDIGQIDRPDAQLLPMDIVMLEDDYLSRIAIIKYIKKYLGVHGECTYNEKLVRAPHTDKLLSKYPFLKFDLFAYES